jgi:hypothetical protein
VKCILREQHLTRGRTTTPDLQPTSHAQTKYDDKGYQDFSGLSSFTEFFYPFDTENVIPKLIELHFVASNTHFFVVFYFFSGPQHDGV